MLKHQQPFKAPSLQAAPNQWPSGPGALPIKDWQKLFSLLLPPPLEHQLLVLSPQKQQCSHPHPTSVEEPEVMVASGCTSCHHHCNGSPFYPHCSSSTGPCHDSSNCRVLEECYRFAPCYRSGSHYGMLEHQKTSCTLQVTLQRSSHLKQVFFSGRSSTFVALQMPCTYVPLLSVALQVHI